MGNHFREYFVNCCFKKLPLLLIVITFALSARAVLGGYYLNAGIIFNVGLIITLLANVLINERHKKQT